MTPHVSITLLRTQSDDRLVKLTTAGHDRAFEAIVDRYRRPLLRYARRFLSEGRAEDVVQAAFVSAWSALGEGAEVRDLRPWLYRIVHNGALNAMKRPGGEDAPLIDMSAAGPGPEAEVEARDDMRRTLDGIAALPDRQRAALVAVAVDGRAHADVAAELGLTDTAVRQLVRRARVSLRAAATAITPWPAAAWLAQVGTHHQDSMTSRIAEAVAGTAGTAGIASGAVIKTGAVVATVGVIAAGAPQVEHAVQRHRLHHHPSTAHVSARAASVVDGARAAATRDGLTAAGTMPAALRTSGAAHRRRHRNAQHDAADTFQNSSGRGGSGAAPVAAAPTSGSRHSSGDSGSRRRDGSDDNRTPSGSGSPDGTRQASGDDGSGVAAPSSGSGETTTSTGGDGTSSGSGSDDMSSGTTTSPTGSGDGTPSGSDSGATHDSGSPDPTLPVSDH